MPSPENPKYAKCPKIMPFKNQACAAPLFMLPVNAISTTGNSAKVTKRSVIEEQKARDLAIGIEFGRGRRASAFFPNIQNVTINSDQDQTPSPASITSA